MEEYEKKNAAGVNSEDSLLVVYILRILKRYSSPNRPLSSQDVMEYLKLDYSIGCADKVNAQQKKIRRHLDTLHDYYGRKCIGKVAGKTPREGHKWFYDETRDEFASEDGVTKETLSDTEINFIIDIITSSKIINSESTVAIVDKLLKKIDLTEREREYRTNLIKRESWTKSINDELISRKKYIEAHSHEAEVEF